MLGAGARQRRLNLGDRVLGPAKVDGFLSVHGLLDGAALLPGGRLPLTGEPGLFLLARLAIGIRPGLRRLQLRSVCTFLRRESRATRTAAAAAERERRGAGQRLRRLHAALRGVA
eukprot:6612075-Prymnesium_polylepis.1